MKIAVLCANGKSGKNIVNEALKKGLEVVAFVRGSAQNLEANLGRIKVVKKDIFALTAADLEGFEIIADAFGEWQNLNLHLKHIEHLVKILQNNKARFIVVGGAGSLFMDASHTTRLMDSLDFPKEYSPVAKATAEVLEFLRKEKSLNWLYISPAAEYDPSGKRGDYRIIGEEFALNAENKSYVSYADLAAALVEAATSGEFEKKYARRRISVLSE